MNKVFPQHQQNWKGPAVANFCLGGCGSAMLAWFALLQPEGGQWLFWAGLGMMSSGLVAVAFELGRPLRGLRSLRHLGSSWMTREVWAAIMTIVFCLLVLANNQWALKVAGLSALIFLFCQAMILRAAQGVPAWRLNAVVGVIIVTGLGEGGALIFWGLGYLDQPNFFITLTFVGLIVIRLLVFVYYGMLATESRLPANAAERLSAIRLPILIWGHLFPAILVFVPIWWIQPLAFLLFIGVGWWSKYFLIRRIAFTQGFAIHKMPVRGANRGTSIVRLSGIKPGWTEN